MDLIWPLYATGLMGSKIKKGYLFTKEETDLTDLRNVLTTTGKNAKEGRDEKKRKWEWSGEPTHGSSFFSCHPFNCFLAVVTMTGLQGEKSCPNTHKCTCIHAGMCTVLQCDRAAREELKWPPILECPPLFFHHPQIHCLFLPLRQQ